MVFVIAQVIACNEKSTPYINPGHMPPPLEPPVPQHLQQDIVPPFAHPRFTLLQQKGILRTRRQHMGLFTRVSYYAKTRACGWPPQLLAYKVHQPAIVVVGLGASEAFLKGPLAPQDRF